MESGDELSVDEIEAIPTLDELKKWKVKELKNWLIDHGLKRSGNKNILVKRVFRAFQNLFDSDSDISDEEDSSPYNSCSEKTFQKLENCSEWTGISHDNLPSITDKDIENYYMFQKNPMSGRRARFQRHLLKARKFAREKYLTNIKLHPVNTTSDTCFIKANCKPSMKTIVNVGNSGQTDTKYTLNVCLAKSTGHIIDGYCNCKAGAAGLCAHIGGLLFTIVGVKNACTLLESTWERPRPIANKPSPKRLIEVKLSTSNETQNKEKLRPYPDEFQASACKDPDNFLADLLNGLGSINPECVLYKTLRNKTADISDFLEIFTPIFQYSDTVDLATMECKVFFETFLQGVILSDDMCNNLEKATKGQAINNNWLEARKVLITASNMGAVCKRKKDEPDNLVITLRGYRPQLTGIKSVNHGRKYENQALKSYKKKHNTFCKGNIELQEKGLIINPRYPFLGASIDGKVICDVCGNGIVEVKCPYGSEDQTKHPWRNMSPEECAQYPNFFCELKNHAMSLKKDHNYMYQVQGQMAICQVKWVDFVVWTKKGLNFERIDFDDLFWSRQMYERLKAFYLYGMLPEIFSDRLKRGYKLYK